MEKIVQRPHGFNDGFEYDDICPSITKSNWQDNNFLKSNIDMGEQEKKQFNLPPELEGKKFRIRKLTPRECFRLMGVADKDIDKLIAAREVDDDAKQMQNEHTSVKRVLSNSSLYKLAGNSIVVDVLYYMFESLFIGTNNKHDSDGQLSLF